MKSKNQPSIKTLKNFTDMSYADFTSKFKDGTFVFSAMPNDSEDHLLAVYSNNSSVMKVLCHIIATDEGLAKMVVELGLKGELAVKFNYL